MAVDTERKRWGMMQWASGPSYYPTLFNPDTNGVDATERATVLKLYGGIAWAGPAAIADVVAKTGGGRGTKRAKKKSRFPRRIVIEGVVYWVNSPEEERQLLAQYQSKVEAEALELAITDAPEEEVAKAKVKVVKAARRLEKVDTREEDWLKRLKQEDEEILMVVLH